jgi:hypothetical protein
MASERLASAILPGLIVCLSLGVLLLGVELSDSVGSAEQLSVVQSAVVVGAAILLYGAVAWRGTAGGEAKALVRWWATMLGTHVALGLGTGAAVAALAPPAGIEPVDALRWAAGISLPVTVLQVGYSIGVVTLAWGRETTGPGKLAATGDSPPAGGEAARMVTVPTTPSVERETRTETREAESARLGVYATAVEQVRAQDSSGLLWFAIQAARCEAGLLATRDGLLVSAQGSGALDPTTVAAILPELLRDLEKLGPAAAGSPVLLHAAIGGYELLAMPGQTLVGCLMGPKPGAREVAEVVLPALVARAENLPRSEATGGAEGLV